MLCTRESQDGWDLWMELQLVLVWTISLGHDWLHWVRHWSHGDFLHAAYAYGASSDWSRDLGNLTAGVILSRGELECASLFPHRVSIHRRIQVDTIWEDKVRRHTYHSESERIGCRDLNLWVILGREDTLQTECEVNHMRWEGMDRAEEKILSSRVGWSVRALSIYVYKMEEGVTSGEVWLSVVQLSWEIDGPGYR
ncbi:hypothetical protein Tco_0800642 [Tanacetum coccineum]|uniref:Uncharacterized protein n=1 Tax=Tanacetum coccineum TaxID=301880 RepID=A0ABQ4ZTP8_9ASTR